MEGREIERKRTRERERGKNTLDENKSEKGCSVNKSKRENKKKKAGSIAFENARPDMISEKSILLKMRDGPTESPSKL